MGRRWLVVAALVAVAVTAPSAHARFLAQSGSAAGRSREAPNVLLAKRLAAEVYGARSNTARYRALLEVMRAIHVGVYTGKGKAVVRGAERSWKDFYLYVPEAQGLAGSEAHRTAFPTSSLVVLLNAEGVRYRGKPLTLAMFPDVVRKATVWAVRHPQKRVALVGLLVRALGLRRAPHLDVARPIPSSKLRLDPLQRFLIQMDVLLGSARARVPATTRTSHARTPATGCPSLPFGRPASYGWGWFSTAVGGFAAAVNSVLGVSQRADAEALASMIALENAGVPRQSTHYGPAGHAPDAGKQMEWKVQVSDLGPQDMTSYDIDCGALAGTTFPASGPLRGVRINWDTSQLDPYGKSVPGQPTDSSGITKLVFTPHDEAVPGFGAEVTAKGTVTARMDWTSIFKGLPAGILEELQITPSASNLGHPEFDIWTSDPWEVTRHAPRGFQFGPNTYNDATYGGDSGFDETVSGHLCGENPFEGADAPWDVPYSITDTYTGSTESYDLTEPLFGPGIEGEATASDPPIPPDPTASHYPDMLWYAPRLTFLSPGPSPEMRVERFTDGGLHVDFTVPVTEDMSCPAPTP
jgi:hypothetical protein